MGYVYVGRVEVTGSKVQKQSKGKIPDNVGRLHEITVRQFPLINYAGVYVCYVL